MNRTRTGRGAPPWAWMQTGPLTVDVEACMSNPNRERLSAEAAGRISANIHTEAVFAEPTNAATESDDDSAQIVEATDPAPTQVAEATERFATVKLVYTPVAEAPGAGAAERGLLPERAVTHAESQLSKRQGTALAVPSSMKQTGVLTPEAPAAKSAAKRPRSKAEPAKRKRNLLGTRKFRRPSVPRKQSQPKTQAQIDVIRHRRVCTICHHPEREAIEESFLQWRSVKLIAREFNATGGATSIYRHARALALFKKRNLTLRTCLEFVIEQSERIIPTAEGLVKAIRAYTRINDAGEWIDTPTTHIVKVVAMARDGRDLENPAAKLTLDVRKDRSNVLYPTSGQIESAACPDSGRAQQEFLPGSAQKAECDVNV